MPRLMKTFRVHSRCYGSWAVRCHPRPCGYRCSLTADVLVFLTSKLRQCYYHRLDCRCQPRKSKRLPFHPRGLPAPISLPFVISLQGQRIWKVLAVQMMADWWLWGTMGTQGARHFVHDTDHGDNTSLCVRGHTIFNVWGLSDFILPLPITISELPAWLFLSSPLSLISESRERAKSMQSLLRKEIRQNVPPR